MPPRAVRRVVTVVGLAALVGSNLTCARPIASGATGEAPSPGASAASRAGEDGTVAPLPAIPKSPVPTEHTELRPPGKTIARHVDRGFETLIISTGENLRCEFERQETSA